MMMINDDGDEKWSLVDAQFRLLFLFQLSDILLPQKGETKHFFVRCTLKLVAERDVYIYSQTCRRAHTSRRLVKVFYNFVSLSLLHDHALQVERRRAASRAECRCECHCEELLYDLLVDFF